jgi:hypothetical protein
MAEAKGMNKAERQTLIRLVKQRFKLLETGLSARRSALERVTQQEIVEENKVEAEAWKKRLDEVIAKFTDLLREGEQVIKDAHEAGFDRSGYGWHNLTANLNNVERNATFTPVDLQKKVQERMVEKIGDKPMTRFALEMQESQLVEELLVGDLGSEDAKTFLAQVPTLEDMIPLPNGGANRAALMASQDQQEYDSRRRR